MDILIDKQYREYDYLSRYISVPFYYNTQDDKYIMGIGSNIDKDVEWYAHKIKVSDTLDKLALKYYGNPTYWWIIAYFNDIQDAFCKLSTKYDIIKIPNMSNINFGKER